MGREFAIEKQVPEAVSTRFMFCRAGNLAGQSVTSFARHHPLALECLFRRQTRTETRREGTPRSAQAGSRLPVVARLRQVQGAGGARTLPRRQPAQGDAGVAAVGKGVNGPPCSARHYECCRSSPGLRARPHLKTKCPTEKNSAECRFRLRPRTLNTRGCFWGQS